MAQLPGDARVNQYTATAGQTTFTYDFKIYQDDEITVQQNSTALTLTTDYTVTDAGEEAGGTIVLVTGATVDDIITLTGNSMVERETTFTNGGDFAASAINGEYNKILDMVSENVTEIAKSVRLAVYDASFDSTIPTPVTRKALMINTAADGFEMSTYDPDAQVTLAEAQVALAEDQVALAEAQVALAEAAVTDCETAQTGAELAETGAVIAQGLAEDAQAAAEAALAAMNLGAVTSDIIPGTDATYDLGSTAKSWAEIHCEDLAVQDDVTIAGDLTMTGDIICGAEADIAINTNMFTVDATNGNTVIAGTLSVGGVNVTGATGAAALYDYHVAQNVNGGNYDTANTWQTRPLNTEVFDTIGASLASNRVTLPAGTYTAVANCSGYNTDYTAYRIYDYTNSAVLGTGAFDYLTAQEFVGTCYAAFTLASPAAIEVQMIATASQAGTGMGYAHATAAAGDNFYTQLLITKVA